MKEGMFLYKDNQGNVWSDAELYQFNALELEELGIHFCDDCS